MAEILVLASQIPVPIQVTGTSLRLNPVLRHLSREHSVDLVAVGEDRPDRAALADEAREFCRSVTLLGRPSVAGMKRWARTARGLLSDDRPPWEFLDPLSDEALAEVGRRVSNHPYDVLLGAYNVVDVMVRLLASGAAPPRVVLDWIDSPSLLHERKSRDRPGLSGWLARRRTGRIQRWQREVNSRVDAAMYIAPGDREHAGEVDNPRVHVVPNGVLLPDRSVRAKSEGPPTLGFLGNMAYGPNERAALRLHDRIFTPMRERVPELRLKIIGRSPGPDLRRLASSNVDITGEVDSIWPHLEDVDVMVFPMETGGGLQNKILESLIADCCVVSTAIGAAGTGDIGRRMLLIRDSDEEMMRAAEELLVNADARTAARESGRRLVRAFDWADILPRYAAIVLGE